MITKAEVRWTNRQAETGVPRRHAGRPSAQGDRDVLQREVHQEELGRRAPGIMLSGEVGYFKGTMQLTHPAFLVLESPNGKNDRHQVAGQDRAKRRQRPARRSACRRSSETSSRSTPPAPRCRAGTSTRVCVRCSTCSTRSRIRCRNRFCAQRNLISEDEALRAIHLAENASDRERARERLTFDEAVGLQWALVARRNSELASRVRRRRGRTTDCSRRSWSGCRSS